jgi:hypothetical protein
MSSPADIHYESLPLNVTYDQLIGMSQFDEYIYNIRKQVKLPDLGLTVDYYTKISREQVRASFVKRFIQSSTEKYKLEEFINDYKVGDIVTLNYIGRDQYYIYGSIINIDIDKGEIKIKNDNPLFIPRTHRFDYYTMHFINSGTFDINNINKSLIKKD